MDERLPTERGFLEDHGCLDAIAAWENFGGLTIDEAYAKFSDSPIHYTEDFMFMGESAFTFYFDVLDRYVREAIAAVDKRAFEEFSGVRNAIWFHFADFGEEPGKERIAARDRADGGRLRQRVVDLCDHLVASLPDLCVGSWPYSNVTEAGVKLEWSGLRDIVSGD